MIDSSSHPRRLAVILAAGKGTRMRSERPKPLFEVAGRPMLEWVIEAARGAGCDRIVVVVGYGAELVRDYFHEATDLDFVLQEEQLGTGHALAQAEDFVRQHVDGEATLVVLNGDVPGILPATVERLAEAAERGWGALGVAELEVPGSLGRVIVNADDATQLERIVEARDATAEQLLIPLINAGFYAVRSPQIFDDLRRLGTNNAQGELYLTDAMGMAADDHRGVELVHLEEPGEAFGINDRRDLARAHRRLIDQHTERLMTLGVTFLDPASANIMPTVTIGADTVIHPGVTALGDSHIGSGCEVHQGCWLRNSRIADRVELKPYSVLDQAHVANDCQVGPFARLRPGTEMLEGSLVGNFVELKKTRLGAGAKASHLTYLGDADVGERANVGAGVVTCNYDGERKHQTTIGSDAFVGSDTMLVAPVVIGDGATTGAGSVITQDVPEGALAVGRARQRNIPDWQNRRRRHKPTSGNE